MSLKYPNQSNQLPRIIPDLTKLLPEEDRELPMCAHNLNGRDESKGAPSTSALTSSSNPRGPSRRYEDCDPNSIMRCQMQQDIIAYRYDLEFCQTQLTAQPDLTPQEIRTLQVRILDCAHNIRHCRHRIQTLDVQSAASGARPVNYRSEETPHYPMKNKKRRLRHSDGGEGEGEGEGESSLVIAGGNGEAEAEADGADADGADDSIVAAGTGADSKRFSPGANDLHEHGIQRLGYWDCRLCKSRKYLEAGPNRVPSAACKWPLKDISKMINHFLDLHTEHTPVERCSELGDALARNRGPFEYWLTRTKSQDVNNVGAVIDEYIQTFQRGQVPEGVRGLIRSATMFPNTVSTAYKK